MSRARHCGTKRRHRTQRAAERHRTRLARAGGRDTNQLDVYPCAYCGSWHVGHDRRDPGKRTA